MESETYHFEANTSNSNLLRIGQDLELQSAAINSDDTFTVQQAVNSLGFGWFHVKLSLFVGLCWMADAMEITILSIIGPSMICDWNITKFKQALTTAVVFFGMMLSTTFWTQLSDRYGRKPALTFCGILLVLYGFLSAMAPSFHWFLILRGFVGFALGCIPQSVTLYAEFLPTKHKGKCMVLMDCFWALGACFEVALALIVLPVLGWKWLLGLSVIPLLLFTVFTPWLTESARFHAVNGRTDKAFLVLQEIAKNNNRQSPIGRLVMDEETSSSTSSRALLKAGLRKTTLILWFIWMACSFCYYGLVLMSTELIQHRKQNIDANECQELVTTDFMNLLWITLSEFPGIFVTLTVIQRFGKKFTMVSELLIFSGCILLLSFNLSRFYNTFILFLARGVISGLFQAVYVYTPEVYPNNLRLVGVASCSTLARLGAMVTPFIAQVLLQTSTWKVLIIYSSFGILAAMASSRLPNIHK